MTRIYEALQHASEKTVPQSPAAVAPALRPAGAPAPAPQSGRPWQEMDTEVLGLYQAVESRLSDHPRKLILFMGSTPGEGTSTLARNVAILAADHMKKQVLLFDADRHAPNQKNYFGIGGNEGWQESENSGGIEDVICRIGDSRLYLCPSSSNVTISPEIYDSRVITATLESLRTRFDLVVIDAPPLSQLPDGLALAPHVDGVVLVVAAESTRWKVAESTKKRLMAGNARILGIAFNKRRFYIPEAVYRRLR